jgi:hypothetical protein
LQAVSIGGGGELVLEQFEQVHPLIARAGSEA